MENYHFRPFFNLQVVQALATRATASKPEGLTSRETHGESPWWDVEEPRDVAIAEQTWR